MVAQKRTILNNSPDTILQLDTDLKIIWANKTALDINSEAIGQTCYKALLGKDVPCESCTCKRAIKTGQPERAVVYQPAIEGIQGETYWDNITIPLKDSNGKIINLTKIARNVTEYKQFEKKLKRAHTELNQIFNAAIPLCLIDIKYNMLRVNDTFCSFFKMERDEILGKKCYDVWQCANHNTSKCPLMHIQKGIEKSECEIDKKLSSGGMVTCLVTTTPYRDLNGELLGIIENFSDITIRKTAEIKIKEANTIINRSPAVAFTWKNEEGWPVEYVSENVVNLFGYPVEDFISGKISYTKCLHPNDLKRVGHVISSKTKKETNQIKYGHGFNHHSNKKGQSHYRLCP